MGDRRQTSTRRKPAVSDEQVLPHALEAEKAVLGAILIANPAYDRAARHINGTSFYRMAHRLVFESFTRLLEQPGGAADIALVREDLANHGTLEDVGGPSYLSSLVDGVPRSTNVEHYAQIVKDKKLLRECITVGQQLVTDAYIGEDPASVIIAAADQSIIQLQQGVRSNHMKSLAATQSAFLDKLQWRVEHKGELTGVQTGFQSVNDMTLGWQPGDIIVLAARPSIGKSSFFLNTALHAAESHCDDGRKRRVVLFSLEMTRDQLENRILASISNIDLSRIAGGYIRDDEWPKINEALHRMREADIYIDDTATRTVSDVRAECRRLKSEGGLDLIGIDYVQLMTGTLERKGANRNDEVTHISQTLKGLVRELDTPLILMSQLSRASESRPDPRPKLSDLRESGSLEQIADIVLFLHRKHHRESGTTQAIFEKQRNGPTGTVNLTLTRETCLFTDGGEDPPPPTAEEQEKESKARKQTFAKRAHAR